MCFQHAKTKYHMDMNFGAHCHNHVYQSAFDESLFSYFAGIPNVVFVFVKFIFAKVILCLANITDYSIITR